MHLIKIIHKTSLLVKIFLTLLKNLGDMKTTLLSFLLFVSFIMNAQSSELLNANWQITKVVGEFSPDYFSPTMPYSQSTTFSATDSKLNSTFFNSVVADITYSGNNMFTLSNKSCTSAIYSNDNGEVNQFFNLVCNFFDSQGNFYYTIENNGTQKKLIIQNSIFGEIHFVSEVLGTKENNLAEYSFAPNPVHDILTIKSPEKINYCQIIDASGKLVLEQNGEATKTLSADVQNLKPGIYFVKLNNGNSHKIIKK